MEMFGQTIGGRAGQNGNNANLAWDIWEMNNGNSNSNGNNDILYMTAATAAVTIAEPPSGSTASSEASLGHALMHNDGVQAVEQHFQNFYGGDHHHHGRLHGSQYLPDPHLMCLKLGKRHYFEDAAPPLLDHHHRHVAGFPLAMKRGKNLYGAGGGGGASTSSLKVPRCQVEGCQVSLVSAKEYHRRHKVCEMHSKASKVVVLGLEQRFCQQCSRSVLSGQLFSS